MIMYFCYLLIAKLSDSSCCFTNFVPRGNWEGSDAFSAPSLTIEPVFVCPFHLKETVFITEVMSAS